MHSSTVRFAIVNDSVPPEDTFNDQEDDGVDQTCRQDKPSANRSENCGCIPLTADDVYDQANEGSAEE